MSLGQGPTPIKEWRGQHDNEIFIIDKGLWATSRGDTIKHETPFGTVEVPDDLLYDPNHIWVREEEGVFVVGWTAFAVQSAGDVSYVTLPKKGTKVKAGKEFGSIETGKWVGRLASPVTGEIIEVNDRVTTDPELVNDTPYSDGWLLRIKGRMEPATKLMSAEEYLEIVKAGKAF